MKKIIDFVKKHLVLFSVLVCIILALFFALIIRVLNTNSDDIKDNNSESESESALKEDGKKRDMYNRYWVSVSGGTSAKDKYNDVSSSNLDVL